jgi:hypothetical protein
MIIPICGYNESIAQVLSSQAPKRKTEMFAFTDYIGERAYGQAEKSTVLFCFQNKILNNVWNLKIWALRPALKPKWRRRGESPEKPDHTGAWFFAEFIITETGIK